jgi:hypothetical protein
MDSDDQALVLRDQGGPFARIAEILELDSVFTANPAFNRDQKLGLNAN